MIAVIYCVRMRKNSHHSSRPPPAVLMGTGVSAGNQMSTVDINEILILMNNVNEIK